MLEKLVGRGYANLELLKMILNYWQSETLSQL